MAAERHRWVDIARGLSIVLVVAHHARFSLDSLGVSDPRVVTAVQFFTEMRMPLFFAAAGLFAGGWARRPWPHLLRGKILALAWVFVIWQPVVLAYQRAELEWLPNQSSIPFADQAVDLLLAPVLPNGELWFLWALAIYFIVAKAISRWRPAVVVGASLAVSFGWTLLHPVMPSGWSTAMGPGWTGLPRFACYFFVAMALAPHILRLFGGIGARRAALLILPWLAVTVGQRFVYEIHLLVPTAIGLMAVVAGFALATLVARLPGVGSAVAGLGRQTLPIYVAHTAVITAIVLAVVHGGGLGPASASPGLTLLAVTALAIAISLGIHALAMRVGARWLYHPPRRWSWTSAGRAPSRRTARQQPSAVTD